MCFGWIDYSMNTHTHPHTNDTPFDTRPDISSESFVGSFYLAFQIILYVVPMDKRFLFVLTLIVFHMLSACLALELPFLWLFYSTVFALLILPLCLYFIHIKLKLHPNICTGFNVLKTLWSFPLYSFFCVVKVRAETKIVHISTFSWMRLGFLVDVKGRVPVKVVARTFASGKTEKMVYQCLADLGLPSGKSDTMDKADFTFEKFYALYHAICPRNDIEDLFRSMWVKVFRFLRSDV